MSEDHERLLRYTHGHSLSRTLVRVGIHVARDTGCDLVPEWAALLWSELSSDTEDLVLRVGASSADHRCALMSILESMRDVSWIDRLDALYSYASEAIENVDTSSTDPVHDRGGT